HREPDVGRVARDHLGRVVDDRLQPLELLVHLLRQQLGALLVLGRHVLDALDLVMKVLPVLERQAPAEHQRRAQPDGLYHWKSTRRSLAQPLSSVPVASSSPLGTTLKCPPLSAPSRVSRSFT